MPQTQKPIIAVRDLNVTYFPGKSNEVQSLKHISLEIYPGEFIIFFGPSGCGKSTLLYSISGLETNISGRVVVEGKELVAMNKREKEALHQTTIGMIFQAFYLIPSITVLQNVALPQMAVRGGKRQREERAQGLLTKFGVGLQAKKLPMELSGGQQQRVSICRSLMNDPAIIVADEPVGNLDTKSSNEVLQMLRDLNDKDKKTVILVTHDPSHIHHAHRVFYMRDGEIIETKTNTEEERKSSPVITAAEKMSLPAALQQWAKTFSAESLGNQGDMVAAAKAHEILTEVMTGMTMEEMGLLEQALQKIIKKHSTNKRAIYHALHAPLEKGGLEMDATKARHLTESIASIVRELKQLQAIEKRPSRRHIDPLEAEVQELRRFLLDEVGIHLRSAGHVPHVDAVVRGRLEGTADSRKTYRMLIASVKKGGIGLGRRKARLFIRTLEPLVLERAKPKPESKPAAKKEPAPAPAQPTPQTPVRSLSPEKHLSRFASLFYPFLHRFWKTRGDARVSRVPAQKPHLSGKSEPVREKP